MERLPDAAGRERRLTAERLDHIERRPEMVDSIDEIAQTLAEPDEIRESDQDPAVNRFYRHYPETPVSAKYRLVIAEVDGPNPFVITAFYTDRLLDNGVVWASELSRTG